MRDYEIDSQGIVNNAIYLHYLELTRHEYCRAAGTSFRDMQAQGIDPVLRRIDAEYLTSLTMGDEMISCLNLRREGPRVIFDQDIYRASDQTPVLRSHVTIVSLEDGRLSRGDRMASLFADLNP